MSQGIFARQKRKFVCIVCAWICGRGLKQCIIKVFWLWPDCMILVYSGNTIKMWLLEKCCNGILFSLATFLGIFCADLRVNGD